jgi:hypothetical protein
MDAGVVVEGEVGAKSLPQLRIGVEPLAMDVLALQGMEERFHVGVVIHLARPIHALDEALAAHDCAVSVSGVFDTPVAVEHQARAGTALAQGVEEGCAGERDIARGVQTPAQNAARELVHHDGQIAPLTAHLQVSDIAHPDLVRSHEVEVTLAVGNAPEEAPVAGLGAPMLAGRFTSDVGSSHEASNAALTNALALFDECVANTRAAVAVQAAGVDLDDALSQALVLDLACTGRARCPGVEARTGDFKVTAHHRDRAGLPVCFDEGEDFAFSSEANRIAFFRMACST